MVHRARHRNEASSKWREPATFLAVVADDIALARLELGERAGAALRDPAADEAQRALGGG
jgi:hypothetical protein